MDESIQLFQYHSPLTKIETYRYENLCIDQTFISSSKKFVTDAIKYLEGVFFLYSW